MPHKCGAADEYIVYSLKALESVQEDSLVWFTAHCDLIVIVNQSLCSGEHPQFWIKYSLIPLSYFFINMIAELLANTL